MYKNLATSCFESCRLIGALPDVAKALAPQLMTCQFQPTLVNAVAPAFIMR